MATIPRDFDGFMPLLSTTDIKNKLTVGNHLLNYLADPSMNIECQDIGLFIDNLVPWLNSSNPKVAQNGLEALTYLADRMGHDFRHYVSTIIQPSIDRLGDSKDTTKEKARMLLLKIMEKGSLSPQHLLDKLQPAFSHKNSKLREEALFLLTTTLNEHGADELSLSGAVPNIVKLLSDPSEKVRDTAMNTITDMYRHVGERLRVDLQRKHNVPQAKLSQLLEKFDQLKASGDMLPQAKSIDVGKQMDEVDRAIKSAPVKRTTSMLQKRSQFGPSKLPPPTSGSAGAVDEETFLTAFEDVPHVNLFSARDLEDQIKGIRDFIGDDKKDWKQRTDHMKKLRAIVIANGTQYENFLELLKSLQRPLESSINDLRSQVVREACITLAFLSIHLKTKFATVGEGILPALLNLIQNSAKVVATAGAVAVRFILQNTHSSRYVPVIVSAQSHKSKDIRRAACEYLHLILQSWPTHLLQRHVNILQEAIKKGMADSDVEARAFARKSYWAFKEHFPENAEMLLNSLDATYKRALMSLSNSGSVNSLNSLSKGSSSNVSPRALKSNISITGRAASPVGPGARSSSVDVQAAQRVLARTKYATLNRQKAVLPRLNKSPELSMMASPERIPRPRTRYSGVTQSQPASRSGSPSSRFGYATYNRDGESLLPRSKILTDQMVRSTGTSREPSPHRFGFDRSFGSKLGSRGRNLHMSPIDKPFSRPIMAQKLLAQSREAESALADAFDSMDNCGRSLKHKGEHSDESETSSICSERSHESSFRRQSDSYSWSGSQSRLYREAWDQSIPKDITEIIENCGKRHWADRKEGLIGLQHFLVNGYSLNASELRKVTEIFAKMFMDSHTKVFSLFLDTLNELIHTHYEDLGDWLYVLITRLLNKLGTDLLGSVQAKIHKTLDVVRECFSGKQLMPAVMRFVTNPTQTPNSRVKVATLTFITQIAESTEPSSLQASASPAIAKLLDWTNDVKSQEVRRFAHNAVIAIYNLNPSLFTIILSELPKYYQETALPIVQTHVRKTSLSSNPIIPATPPPKFPASPSRVKRSNIDSTDESLNPEEVYKSLQRTSNEIQNYGFGRLERATTSKDSGISNMADIEEKVESLNISNSENSSAVSSPIHITKSTNLPVNGSSGTPGSDLVIPRENNGYKTRGMSPEMIKGPDILDNILKTLQAEGTPANDKVVALQELQLYVRDGDPLYMKQSFRKLLKTLIGNLLSDNITIQQEVLQCIIDLLKCPELTESFSNYAELLVLKVIRAHKFDDQKFDGTTNGSNNSRTTVLRMAEKCAATVAAVLPPEQTIQFASSMMTTEPFPNNMGAIKMLQKVVEHWGRKAIEPHLGKVMPGLIKAYDDKESTVRKSAVFCMVAIHGAVGQEELDPYLSSLYGSKLKLLNIYITRAQQTNGSHSNGNSPNSSNTNCM